MVDLVQEEMLLMILEVREGAVLQGYGGATITQ